MISLVKDAEPAVLAANRERWTHEYADALAKGDKPPSRWRHPELVSALLNETTNKCAYCEGYVPDVAYPNVEHLVPKAVKPELVVEWSNLGIACPVCNTNKLDYFNPELPLVNPYVENPQDHFVLAGPMMSHAPGDARARQTIRRLKLQRAPLVLARMKRIEELHVLLEGWSHEVEPNKSVLADEIHDRIAADQEFSAFLSAYARFFGFA